MINFQWLELPISRTNFYGAKDVRAIEVRQYLRTFWGHFLILFENVCCISFKSHHRCDSNKYTQHTIYRILKVHPLMFFGILTTLSGSNQACLEQISMVPKSSSHRSSTAYTLVCIEVLRPSQPIGVMSSAVSLPNHTFTGQA